jgi:hypothetical protein
MTDGSAGAPSACANCGQSLPSGTARCIWCGARQPDAAPPLLISGPPPASSMAAPSTAGPAPTAASVALDIRASSDHRDALPPAFRGSIAGTAPRLVAFSADVVLLAVVAGVAFALSRSAAVTVAVVLEALLVGWILHARTGATPGKALLRLRASRVDRPASPGAWGRSVVVAVPPQQRTAAPAAPLHEPHVVSLTPSRPADEGPGDTGAPPALGAVPQLADAPASDGGQFAAGMEGSVLLVFDTGQRVQLPVPVAVNLGRNPVATHETDRLITVEDPDSTVSKTHARLEHSRGATWITDAGSTNGTEIISDEGVVTVLAPRKPVQLDEGARVRLGKRVFTVSVVIGGEGG